MLKSTYTTTIGAFYLTVMVMPLNTGRQAVYGNIASRAHLPQCGMSVCPHEWDKKHIIERLLLCSRRVDGVPSITKEIAGQLTGALYELMRDTAV